MPRPGEVTRLLESWSGGRKDALNELVPIIHDELRALAAAFLRRERPGHTLQPTALVHEAYLRLVDQSNVECRNRTQFFGIAANLMRQILVDHARRRLAVKRGGRNQVSIEEADGVVHQHRALVELDEALERLAKLDPRQSRIVELRFFVGLTAEQIGEVLGISAVTVQRDWRIARAVLHHELRPAVLARTERP